MSDPGGKVHYRSWNPLQYGDTIDLSRFSEANQVVLKDDGIWQIINFKPFLSLAGQTEGYLLVSVPMDERFLAALAHDTSDNLRIGVRADEMANRDIGKEDWIRGTVASSAVSGVWYELSRDARTVEIGGKRLIILFAVSILIVALISAFYSIMQLNRDVVHPIDTIFQSVLAEKNGDSDVNLPDNELGELGRALIYQRKEIKKRDALMKEMTSQILRETSMIKVLSHDLSTPISVITMSAQLLRDEAISRDVAQSSVNRILAQTQIVNSVLGHVRDMKALESGKRSLELREVSFGQLMDDLSAMFAERLRLKNLRFDWSADDRDVTLVADAISIRVSVLSNIISNAIKFSSRDNKITIRCREVDVLTRIDIRDYGPGMPEEIRANLFSSEYATSRAGSEGETGTGFGMPLVKF